ncbi:hypothetical protein L6164_014989 [Bauhinia variegata]|uniref:Uncharacterized protein n=1 Tax=Bauhinia variegata TaxID=167791 RepID=A0ACB9NMT6_BAUVA|nr:hypothetical protein L6164_014989 [Bauhinia variegata]
MKSELELPPGFRFHPTDEELVNHYLCRKCASQSIAVPIIKEIDLYKFDPWQLPGMALYGEKEWSAGKKTNLRLDDWVLCRIYNKKGTIEKYGPMDQKLQKFSDMHEHETKPEITMLGQQNMVAPSTFTSDQLYMDTSDSVPRVHTDSSSSEHVVSRDITWDREVQSEPKWNELGLGLGDAFDFQFNYMDNLSSDDPFAPGDPAQLSPLQDMFMYLQKPF